MTHPPLLHPLPEGAPQPPPQFTYPFCYTPHPLCRMAAQEVMGELARHPQWWAEAQEGKMMGVLVVDGGFLAAFSGTLCGRSTLPYFVPPVFDLHEPDGHFQREEANISRINAQIREAQASPLLNGLARQRDAARQQAEREIETARQQMAQAKALRDERRARGEEEAVLQAESQFQKAELRRIKQRWNATQAELDHRLHEAQAPIRQMEAERARRSAALQTWLFEAFVFRNGRGEAKALPLLFPQTAPPAGAGECCAPKLLQYAYLQGLRPRCMAEFWVGRPPKDELRQEGRFYPACQAKCKPILTWMLQGLDVEPNPMAAQHEQVAARLRIVYQDQDLIVCSKPAGLLSVPGKEDWPSVESEVRRRFPQARGPFIVHRLDMATSGLLVVALTPEAHHHLQQQFLRQTVEKRYTARVVRPLPHPAEGQIALPLCPNPNDRPRQMVSQEWGKPALTRYRSIGPHTLHLWPQTGRTHQLRVHLAHPQGLDNPIEGDTLYGTPADRLCLHADRLSFLHPRTGERLTFEDPEANF